MIQVTVEYPFEYKILKSMDALGYQLFNIINPDTMEINDDRGYVFEFDKSGRLNRINSSSFELMDSGEKPDETTPMLFYDNFQRPEHVWIGWNLMTREMMERVLNLQFDKNDFVSRSGVTLFSFPESHQVVF